MEGTMNAKRLILVAALVAWPGLAGAQNREHLQMNADLRILQEQLAKMQLFANQLAEAVKAIDKRLDDQANSTTKGFADQQVLINSLSATSNTIREKLDDNSVRVSQMTQEFRAIQQGLRQLVDRMNLLTALLQPAQNPQDPNAPADASGASSSSGIQVPDSPGRIFEAAMGDYMSARNENAIEGFAEYIEKFPDSPDAAKAQFYVGESYYQMGKFREAIEAYGRVIETYKTAEQVPDAYFKQGMSYQNLGQRAQAQRVFQLIIRQYPDSNSAIMAGQRLRALGVAPN
jgi:tol-pal system protein YbgF